MGFLEPQLGTQMLKNNVLEPPGMTGYTKPSPTLILTERRLPSSDAETKNPMLITTVMPLVNFTTNSRLEVLLSMEPPPLMDTTTWLPRQRLMESLLDSCVTKTTNMMNLSHAPKHGLNNLREKVSSKLILVRGP